MTLPTVLGVTAMAALGSGGGAGLTRAWIAGHQAGDVAIFGAESANEGVTIPTGFTEDTNSPQGTGTAGGATATRLTVGWKRATSGSEPDIQIPTAGDHIAWWVIFLRNCFATGNPIVASAGNTGSGTGISIPGLTTPNADCMILSFIAYGSDGIATQISGWANASLANLTQRINEGTGSGNGGGLGLVTGEKATAGAVSATTATLANSFAQGRLCLAVRGLASGGGTLVASDFLCSGACNAPPGPAGPGTRHWDSQTGTPFVSQTAIARGGGRAWRSSPVGAQSFRSRAISGSKRWLRYYIRFPTLPNVDTVLLRFRVASGGNSPELRYRQASQDIVGAVGSQVTTGHPVFPGQWYMVNVAADVSVNPRTMKLTVAPDGGSNVDRGTASLAVPAGTFTFLDVGASVQDSITADVVLTTLRTGEDVSLYPVAQSASIAIQLTGDGTHSFSPAGDFKYNNSSNVGTAATDTWTRLVGLLDNFTEWLAASAAATGEYLEWLLTGSMPATSAIPAIEIISTHAGSDVNPHKQTMRMIDGGTTLDLFTDLDFSDAPFFVQAKHLRLAPSGVAWTTALWNAIKLRWGSSWTAADVAGVPYLGGIMAEAEVTLSTPPPPPPDPSPQNPGHVYPAAGTYQVTQTVTDDQGLSDSVTHPVTVS